MLLSWETLMTEKETFMQEMTYKRNKNRKIVGRKNHTSLKTVHGRSWVFLSRLDPSTKEHEVLQYLKTNGIDDAQCFKLNIKSQEISAFKLIVPNTETEKVLDENFWPQNAIVRRFDRQRIKNFTQPASITEKTTED